MSVDYTQRPKGGNKYLTVGDLLEMAEKIKKLEIPHERLLRVDGVIGWGNELRGLGLKENKKA